MCPLDKYYGGHGQEVMSHMEKEYGDKKGTQVFYATKNKRDKADKLKKAKGHKK